MSDIVSKITTSIGEQAKATRHIADRIREASSGASDANIQVSQTSQVSGEISKDIASVNSLSGEMTSSSELLLVNSGEISQVADRLKSSMARFQAFYVSYDSLVAGN